MISVQLQCGMRARTGRECATGGSVAFRARRSTYTPPQYFLKSRWGRNKSSARVEEGTSTANAIHVVRAPNAIWFYLARYLSFISTYYKRTVDAVITLTRPCGSPGPCGWTGGQIGRADEEFPSATQSARQREGAAQWKNQTGKERDFITCILFAGWE